MGPQTVEEAYVQLLGAGYSCSTTPNPQPDAPGACDGGQSTSSGTPMPSVGEPWLSQENPGCARQKSPAPVWLPAWTTKSSGERGRYPMVSSVGTYPVLSAMAELIANSK